MGLCLAKEKRHERMAECKKAKVSRERPKVGPFHTGSLKAFLKGTGAELISIAFAAERGTGLTINRDMETRRIERVGSEIPVMRS
jgi:hypothetical protein